MNIKILGVKIDLYTKGEAIDKVAGFLTGTEINTIYTPNPEMLVAAHKDSYLKEILNKGTMNICDGRGLELLCKVKRLPGVDFMIDICQYAEKTGRSVYLLGDEDIEFLKKTADELKKRFPGLKIAGYNSGPKLKSTPNKKLEIESGDNWQIIAGIINSSADILFVGFGHSKQEKWIFENLEQLAKVRIAMGVGGSFDMISGKIKRAPKFMRQIGLEWLWRLIQEPRRIGRIWTALIIFSISLLFYNKK